MAVAAKSFDEALSYLTPERQQELAAKATTMPLSGPNAWKSWLDKELTADEKAIIHQGVRSNMATDTTVYEGARAPFPKPDANTEALAAYFNNPFFKIYSVVSLLATPALAYHGYKRNNSAGWAVAWFFMPVALGIPIALAQGFGKPRVKTNPSKRKRLSR